MNFRFLRTSLEKVRIWRSTRKIPGLPIFRLMVAGLVGFIVALWSVTPVLSHGDEPRVEISSERITPGGVIEVRGVDLLEFHQGKVIRKDSFWKILE